MTTYRTEREWQQFYDDRAKRGGSLAITFGFVTPKTYNYRQTAIFETLTSLPVQLRDKWIADVGCGSGLISLPFRDDNRLVGIDISLEMLRLARQNELHGAAASALALPLRSAHFDVTIAAGIIQHFPRADEVARECARITKPGGHVVVETINSESLLRRAYRFFVRGDNLKSTAFRIGDLVAALDLAGIDLMKIVYLYYPITYRKTYASQAVTFAHRTLSSAFIVVGKKR